MKRFPHIDFWLLVIAWAAICFCAATCHGESHPMAWRAARPTQSTDLWEWSPSAEHHAAVVRVTNPVNGNAGSGVFVDIGNGVRGVLTAQHVADGATARCTFANGEHATGPVTYDKFRHDLAFVFVEHAGTTPLSIASCAPPVGSRVEFVSYGGPEDKLRHFYGRSHGSGEYQVVVVSGDSGCPILDDRRQVVGVQSVGHGAQSLSRSWGIFRGSGAAPFTAMSAFCQRVAQCGPAGCRPPQRRGLDWGIGGHIGPMYPPAEPRIKTPPVLPGPAVPIIPAEPAKPLVPVEPITPEPVDEPIEIEIETPAVPPAITVPSPPLATRDDLDLLGESLLARLSELAKRPVPATPMIPLPPESVGGRPPATDKPPPSKIPWDMIALAAASAFGVGVPTWAIMAYRGAKAVKRLRDTSREEPDTSTLGRRQSTHTTTIIDAPPSKDRVRLETQFVNVTSDHYQRAHELARQQIARRYPGAQDILEAELSLTRQFAAGEPS